MSQRVTGSEGHDDERGSRGFAPSVDAAVSLIGRLVSLHAISASVVLTRNTPTEVVAVLNDG